MAAFLILYYFQSEPGESVDSPNAFSIPKGSNSNITFGQFLDRFPAANGKGRLHYRFRSDDSSCGYVWLDMADRSEVVPVSAGVMTCKILCLDSCTVAKRYSRLKLKGNLNTGEEGAAVMRAKRLNQEKPSNSSKNDVNNANMRTSGIEKHSLSTPDRYTDNDSSKNNEHPFGEDDSFEEEDNYQKAPIYNSDNGDSTRNGSFGSERTAPAVLIRASSTVDNLLDNDDPPPVSTANKSRPVTPSSIPRPPAAVVTPPAKQVAPLPVVEQEADMFHFEADAKTSKGTSTPGAPDVHMSREELVTRREAVLEGKVKEALEFKQELDENSKREAEELEAARTKYEKSLLTWSTNNKEKRNVRTLLTTMHTVLWTGKGNTWKTIGLGDVIEPKQVKLQYRKAMLVVHPDRCSSLTTETKFIAKRIFEGINEAYQEFLKKESV